MTPRIAYPNFIPTATAHARVSATLRRVQRSLELRNEWTDHPDLLLALRDLHPRRVYEAARFFCTHRATLLAAIEEDAAEFIVLRVDGLGLREGLERYIPWMGVKGATRMLRALADRGFDLGVAEPGGHRMTALHYAVEPVQLDTLRFLLSKVDHARDTRNARGLTPLGYAVMIGRADAASLLIEAGAEVDASLLVMAISIGAPCRELILAATDVDRADPSRGLTPLEVACQTGDQAAADLLRARSRQLEASTNTSVNTGSNAFDGGLRPKPSTERMAASPVTLAPTLWV